MTNELPEEEDQRRRELYNQGYNDRQLAKEVDVGRVAIRDWRHRRGLDPNGSPEDSPLSDEEEAARRELYDDGYSDKDIALERGVSREAIRAWRKRRGLPVKERNRPEEAAKVERQVERAEEKARESVNEVLDKVMG